MERGEIWWAALPAPMGRRPVVVVSRSRAIQVRQSVTVAAITTVIRKIPVEVPLGPEEGLPKRCVANCDVLNTIPKHLLNQRVGALPAEKLRVLNAALRFALAVD